MGEGFDVIEGTAPAAPAPPSPKCHGEGSDGGCRAAVAPRPDGTGGGTEPVIPGGGVKTLINNNNR